MSSELDLFVDIREPAQASTNYSSSVCDWLPQWKLSLCFYPTLLGKETEMDYGSPDEQWLRLSPSPSTSTTRPDPVLTNLDKRLTSVEQSVALMSAVLQNNLQGFPSSSSLSQCPWFSVPGFTLGIGLASSCALCSPGHRLCSFGCTLHSFCSTDLITSCYGFGLTSSCALCSPAYRLYSFVWPGCRHHSFRCTDACSYSTC